MSNISKSPMQILPVLPLRNTVILPGAFAPLSAGRPGSVAAIDAALAREDKALVIVAQRDPQQEQPSSLEDLYPVGTLAVLRKMARSASGAEVLVQGMERVRLLELERTQPYLEARVQLLDWPEDMGPEIEALFRSILDITNRILEISGAESPPNLREIAAQEKEPLRVAYFIASLLSLEIPKEQALLEAPTRLEAFRLLYQYLQHELQVQELRHKIQQQAQSELTKQQREYMLRQQLRAIQEELGEKAPEKAEIDELRQRLAEADLPDEARKEAERELNRLERLPPMAPDYQVIRTWLELVLELPWRKETPDQLDIARARQVLDEDHYGLEEIKARILEHLAVLKLNPQAKAPILCFVGPPGVGKTSLGQSIARALGRKFERQSLGGLHDEAELRGHRRTYIGAMPGRIIQAIRRAGVKNPVLMLDEVDKIGRDFRGDPAAALLEILDPAQNTHFRDNYLDLPFDLSKVFFITTANNLMTIPQPLLDRMEVLRLAGYSPEEKMQIAQRYLIPRQLKEAGLTPEQLTILPTALDRIIRRYTREAGVRELERTLGRLARKVAVRFAEGKTEAVTVRAEDLSEMLGPERFFPEQARDELPPGVATGLAWTETGGEVLYIEAVLLPEAEGLRLTGQLGRVMRESALAARSFVWSHAEQLGISPKKLRRHGIHIHVPAGAVPKDGPSAGVAMVTALTSLLTGLPARQDTAMTGEITLTGLVLPVGGIKEKVLAAHRAGIRRVILPRENQKDLREVPDHVRQQLEFLFANNCQEVLHAAIPNLPRQPAAASAPV